MKTKKEIIKRYKRVCKEWDKKVRIHVDSKESNIKGHVTNQEHLSGEIVCRLEGEMKALEWFLDGKILNEILNK